MNLLSPHRKWIVWERFWDCEAWIHDWLHFQIAKFFGFSAVLCRCCWWDADTGEFLGRGYHTQCSYDSTASYPRVYAAQALPWLFSLVFFLLGGWIFCVLSRKSPKLLGESARSHLVWSPPNKEGDRELYDHGEIMLLEELRRC